MERTLTTFALLVLAIGCGGGRDTHDAGHGGDSHAARDPAHWGYGPDDGPARWGEMNADWSACASGRSQSPIDLAGATPGDIPPTNMSFPPAELHIVHQTHVLEALDNGHTIQVNYDGGETLSIGEENYRLVQYHFHSPSEHTVGGEHYPMEMHLVHAADSGKLAVVGVFIEQGEHHGAFDAVWSKLPREEGEQVRVDGVEVDVDDMLPESHTSYRYHGSLTTPPCSESVRWIVMTDPIQFDAGQIEAFREVFTGNNRPPQSLNRREVLTDRIEGY